MHILFTSGPFGGPFLLVAGSVAGCLLAFLDRRVVVRYQFMGVHAAGNMTCENVDVGFVVASLVFTRFLLFGLFGRLFTSSWWVWGRAA
ncbi:hypothetical protein [Arthrobacter sp. OAP107]|uniref:hypothetical protein n=1 Tax=Arthrobacter sp. OAP107 TaxID=3156445 RepID=UPI00339B5546